MGSFPSKAIDFVVPTSSSPRGTKEMLLHSIAKSHVVRLLVQLERIIPPLTAKSIATKTMQSGTMNRTDRQTACASVPSRRARERPHHTHDAADVPAAAVKDDAAPVDPPQTSRCPPPARIPVQSPVSNADTLSPLWSNPLFQVAHSTRLISVSGTSPSSPRVGAGTTRLDVSRPA